MTARVANHSAGERLQAAIADPELAHEVFRRMCDGDRLAIIAREKGFPKGRFVEWFMTTQTDLYKLARVVRAEDHALAALDAAMSATPKTAAVMKLRADVLLKLASRLDREHYGESVTVERDVSVKVDVGLIGSAEELLRLIREKPVAMLEAKENADASAV